jgi:hypothetical protein
MEKTESSSSGSVRGTRAIPVFQYDREGNQVAVHPSLTEFCRMSGENMMAMRYRMQKARLMDGFYYSLREDFTPPKR